jgi:trimeric autotransporter adhesin
MEHVKIEGTGTVNISGNTVVFGNRVFRLEGSTWVQQATLGWQGRAIDGNTIVAGDENSAIHVVRYDGANWVNQGRLTPPGDAAASAFGESVAVSGDTIVVGAPNDSEAGERAGAVYVFRR